MRIMLLAIVMLVAITQAAAQEPPCDYQALLKTSDSALDDFQYPSKDDARSEEERGALAARARGALWHCEQAISLKFSHKQALEMFGQSALK